MKTNIQTDGMRFVARDNRSSETTKPQTEPVAHPEMVRKTDVSTPVLLLGGGGNSASVVRNLGRRGITVRLCGPSSAWGVFSRFRKESFIIPDSQDLQAYWKIFLLGPESGALDGHILIALCDASIEFMSENYEALSHRYILEDSNPRLRLKMLDKKATLEQGKAAGVAVPNFWTINSLDDLEEIRKEVVFPVMVKPINSHLFIPVFGRKLFIIEDNFDEVIEKVRLSFEHDLEVMVCEMVPGPDDLLSSYYTYIDADGNNLFNYTKSITRRYPVNRGGACYHQSEWRPETAEQGKKFFASMAWRGMANIEFKHGLRDGKLKVIEVNPRFTDAHRLMVEAGLPLDFMIYCRLTNQPVPEPVYDSKMLHCWNPLRDFLAFLEMRRAGDLTLIGWLKSIGTDRKVLAMFSLFDPIPSVVRLAQEIGRARRKGR
ncbi:MAG: carboxylate--amine ligase [Alphaproteobacteria bacterium]|nr:carboxylate--amine ligase [Alphaproteobacteria bacterium]